MEQIIAKLVRDFEEGRMTRRQLVHTMAMIAAGAAWAGPALAAPSATALYINHVSLQGADYAKARDFYSGLLGMKVTEDDGKSQCRLVFGESILVVRNASSRPGTKQGVDHISYTLANWDTDKNVRAELESELKRRGLKVRGNAESLLFEDPDGFEIQVGGKHQ
jgi:catechol-2,3-dioxygenase